MSDIKPIPGFSRYGITRNAELYNLISNKRLKTSPDPRGYHRTSLVNDEGRKMGVKRHRLVALTYLTPPGTDISNLVVNHKDLIPGNDWDDNLEVCTQKRNVEHWVENGGSRVSTPLETLDGLDGKLTRYNSVAECSKDIGIERYSIQLRLSRGPQYVWPEGKRYRLGHSSDAWPSVDRLEYGRSKEVIARNLITGQLTIFEKLSDFIPLTGYKLGSLWKWASDETQPVIPGLFQIQFMDQKQPWREVEDPLKELQETTKGKLVVVFESDWSNPTWHLTAKSCADTHGLKPTALNHRLKSKGQQVFSDQLRYCYYDDLTEVQRKTIRYEVPYEGCVQRPSNGADQANLVE